MKKSFARFELSELLAATLLERHQQGRLTNDDLRHQVAIGRFTKETCTRLNIQDRVLVTSVSLLVKIMTKHNLTPAVVASLSDAINAPVAAYLSDTERNSIVVVTLEKPDGSNPLVVPFRVDVADSANKPNMHWMVSAYAKDDPAILERWERKGLLIWKQASQQAVASVEATMTIGDAVGVGPDIETTQ